MFEEVTSFTKVITDIGIPTAFFLICLYAIVKLIPNWINVWTTTRAAEQKRKDEEQKSMQEYYNERNKTYQQQMEVMNRQAEIQNSLIGQATLVIAGNTEALKQNTITHEKVMESSREIVASLKEHDVRSQNIYTDVQRVLDKISTL